MMYFPQYFVRQALVLTFLMLSGAFASDPDEGSEEGQLSLKTSAVQSILLGRVNTGGAFRAVVEPSLLPTTSVPELSNIGLFGLRVGKLSDVLTEWEANAPQECQAFLECLGLGSVVEIDIPTLSGALKAFMVSNKIQEAPNDMEEVLERLITGRDVSGFNPLDFYRNYNGWGRKVSTLSSSLTNSVESNPVGADAPPPGQVQRVSFAGNHLELTPESTNRKPRPSSPPPPLLLVWGVRQTKKSALK